MFRSQLKIMIILFSILLILNTIVSLSNGLRHCTVDSIKDCAVDTQIGTNILYEDNDVRIWNLTLEPGQMTSMHRHDCDCHIVTISSSTIEVWDSFGNNVFTTSPIGVAGFRLEGDIMTQIDVYDDALTFPRINAAKNIGNATLKQILYESKTKCHNNAEIKKNVEIVSEL